MLPDRQSRIRTATLSVTPLVAAALWLTAGGGTRAAAQAVRGERFEQPVYRVPNRPVAQPVAQATVPASPAATPAARQAAPRRRPVVRAVATDPSDPFRGVAPEQAGLSLIDTNVRPASATAAASPFDLTQRAGEHPLAPTIRVLKRAESILDQRVSDYAATFTKVERLSGSLGDPQQMQIRVRHRPFSIYMRFVQPNPGQEVLYVENQNDGKLVALASGWKRRIGMLNLDPNGAMAMRDQRYPITRAGIHNLTVQLIKTCESDSRYAECEVTHNDNVKIDGRPVTMIEILHPVPRKNFKFHKGRIFVDHELQAPVAHEKYSWPRSTGEAPPLEERYIYTGIRVNNGFTDQDFSADNPELFN